MEDINCLLCYQLVSVDTLSTTTHQNQNLVQIFSKLFNFSFDTFFEHFDTSFCPKCSSNVKKFGTKLAQLQKLEAQIRILKCQFEGHLMSGYKSSLGSDGEKKKDSHWDRHFDHRCLLVQGLGLLENMKLEEELNDNVDLDVIPEFLDFEDLQDHGLELGKKSKIFEVEEKSNDKSPPDFKDQDHGNSLNVVPNDDVIKSIDKNLIISLQKLKLPADQTSFKLSELRTKYDLKIPRFYPKNRKSTIKRIITKKKKPRKTTKNKDFLYCTVKECGYRSRFQYFMDAHIHRVNNEKEIKWKCPQPDCEYTSFKNCDIVRHERTRHTAEKPFICDLCGRNFATSNYLKKHLTTHDESLRIYKCDVCFKGFFTIHQLKSHLETHKEDQKQTCHACGKVYKNKISFNSHFKIVHLKSVLRKRINCHYCEYTSPFKRTVLRHIRFKHTGEKPYICEQCGRGFVTSTDLKLHFSTHDDSLAFFKCDVCFKGFATISRLKAHQKIHEDRRQTCHVCGKVFMDPYAFETHLKFHTEGFTCSKCGKNFGTGKGLNAHKTKCGSKPLDETPFKCSKCPEKFASNSELVRHVKIVHEGINLFCCTHCEKNYTTKSALIAHERMEHDNSTSDAKIVKTDMLQCIQKISTGELPNSQSQNAENFKCQFCDQKFLQKTCLDKHLTKTNSTCKTQYLKEKKRNEKATIQK